MHCVVISLQATIEPRYLWLIYMTRSFFCRGAWILESYWSISWLTMSIYTLCTIWLFNSSPWKIIIFKNGKPSISMGRLYHGYVSHNQRVNPISSHDSSLLTHCYSPLKITIKSPFIVVKSPLSYGFPMVFCRRRSCCSDWFDQILLKQQGHCCSVVTRGGAWSMLWLNLGVQR